MSQVNENLPDEDVWTERKRTVSFPTPIVSETFLGEDVVQSELRGMVSHKLYLSFS
jgi:hypothetical protein